MASTATSKYGPNILIAESDVFTKTFEGIFDRFHMIDIQFIIIYNIRCKKISVNMYLFRERNNWGKYLQRP